MGTINDYQKLNQ